MKIAILSFFHTESSLCLAKYLGKQGCYVDYYCITDIKLDKKHFHAGFEYNVNYKTIGIIPLSPKEIPELTIWLKDLPVSLFLYKLISISTKILWLNKCFLYCFVRKIKKQNYDAINIVGQNYPLVNIIHKYLKGENIIHSLHEVMSHDLAMKTNTDLMSDLIKDETKVIVHSLISLHRYSQLPCYKKDSAVFIPFGKFETYLLYNDSDIVLNTTSKNIFLFYGFIKPYKGLSVLSEALNILLKETNDFNVIIAGSGRDNNMPFFRNNANSIVLNKHLSNREISALNRLSACIVCPYLSASQSGIVATSFAFGKPLIASRVGAFEECISNEQNGLLVEPNDPQQLANAMNRIIHDKILHEKLCNNVKAFGENDIYDWNIIARKTISVCQEIINN
jgi:glycosyltransferase involved in cell wall biosynthesis